ncbi:hypothetical protein MUO32_08030 [Shinella sp. CPCC 101442]|uniref:hypothetical protein n=1 Tax=Shinella sp. CPCC 101442 TaxID=2932265 RepID=UPI00215213A6|nr:hypothetical protein [Shinella sp. CPCC 101442]MCR6498975.1 hypothetical protein [Shinella sp. CPCC 101442]
MSDLPESMKSDLMEWNNGGGISLADWTANTGNFSLAVGYSELFWPRFVEFEKYVFLEDFGLDGLRSFEQAPGATRRSIEQVMNHLHVADIQHSACTDVTSDKLVILGCRLREIYAVKLAYEFPDRKFSVEFFQPDDPEELEGYQVTFSQT